jgi:hypothetical protein
MLTTLVVCTVVVILYFDFFAVPIHRGS